MSYITDIPHFDGVLAPGVKLPAPAKRMIEFLGRVVSAASAVKPGQATVTDIACMKGTGKKGCQGAAEFVVVADKIKWRFSGCSNDGVISN